MVGVFYVPLALAEAFLVSVLVALARESRYAARTAEKATDMRLASSGLKK